MGYKFVPHTADVKFEAEGGSIEDVFVSSAGALFESVYGKMKIGKKVERDVDVEAEDTLSLLYSFLEEFLFLLDAENFVCSKVMSLKIHNNKLMARVVGDDVRNYKFTNDVKAVTYSDMKVEEVDGEWIAVGVFDV
jgi:SHS2 domain-containing protein